MKWFFPLLELWVGWDPAPVEKYSPSSPILLYYMFEKCKPCCNRRGIMQGDFISKTNFRLHISDYRFYLNIGSGWTTDWRSRGFIISPVLELNCSVIPPLAFIFNFMWLKKCGHGWQILQTFYEYNDQLGRLEGVVSVSTTFLTC